MSFASLERRRLAGLLLDVGPDEPTLCEGWRTRDLACHLYLREHRPDAVAGIAGGPLAARTERVMGELKELPFETVVGRWAAGPGRFSPLRAIDRWVNAVEHFIHHEDVRRARPGWEPRPDGELDLRLLTAAARVLSRALLRRARRPVIVELPGSRPELIAGPRGVARDGSDVTRLRGRAGELILWLSGRDACELEVEGPEPARASL